MTDDNLERIKNLHQCSREIAREKRRPKLLELILESMLGLIKAEGGVFYTFNEDRSKLKFEILFNQSLGIKMGGMSQTPVPFEDLLLYDYLQNPQFQNAACRAAIKDQVIIIDDIYRSKGYDFSKIRKFDKLTKYRTKALMVIPIKNHLDEMLGVVQLVNPRDEWGEFTKFSQEDVEFSLILATWAGVTMTNYHLKEDLSKLFESIVQVLASAVDEKSPYTGGHCRRVPIIAMMIADAIQETKIGPLKDFSLTAEERNELQLAALLHDCGKVTTPVHVMDKATKLETIFDRVELIDYRFEILSRDAEIEVLKKKIEILSQAQGQNAGNSSHASHDRKQFEKLDQDLTIRIDKFHQDREFIRNCNIGGESMTPENQKKVNEVSEKYQWRNPDGVVDDFLSIDEIKNLSISRGTLNDEEREVINHHADMTLKMLTQMHFPKHLQRIPEIASCHHERINGHGYPRGLRGEEMSVQAKLMGIADIFEALTAKDRPYKRGKTLSESLNIMGKMKLDFHIDGDIFNIFMDQKVYLQYAKRYLDDYQIDHIDLNSIPGYILPQKRSAEEEREGKDKVKDNNKDNNNNRDKKNRIKNGHHHIDCHDLGLESEEEEKKLKKREAA